MLPGSGAMPGPPMTSGSAAKLSVPQPPEVGQSYPLVIATVPPPLVNSEGDKYRSTYGNEGESKIPITPGRYALDIAVAVKSALVVGPVMEIEKLSIAVTELLVVKKPVAVLPLLKVTSSRVHVISADAHVANPKIGPAMANNIVSFLSMCIMVYRQEKKCFSQARSSWHCT